MVLGLLWEGLAGCWGCCGRCLWTEDKSSFLNEQPRAEPPLSFALQSSSTAGHKFITTVLKDEVDEVTLPLPSPPQSCCTWITSVVDPHGSPLWWVTMDPLCGGSPWVTSVVDPPGSPLWWIPMSDLCGGSPWVTPVVDHLGSPLWWVTLGHLCGAPAPPSEPLPLPGH